MKGILKKIKETFVVTSSEGDTVYVYPIHPTSNLSTITNDDETVEFSIIEECMNHDHFGKDCSCKTNFVPYALLKT